MTEETKYGDEIGKVIWFDKNKGYGFLRVISETNNLDKEVFIHYSNILSEVPYKKLFPGECVSLTIIHNPDIEGKEYSCKNVTGVFGTKLLCEDDEYIHKVIHKRDDIQQ